ncbi:amino acid/amide ABC transporter ATP-binding protein 2, HAAT family [Desulfatibacillum alkenivorans DSM 16219]|jgi:branched-chain amino acid transport system ATP-binding protein|uniref:Amino acid/amide ABC transporter ATP-binding protein 2, HAAT family n=1 Tax=Desulfatibacillum alkenivorans DSM 16219 TaxID=1121393 RepID=A0A1M6V721_9BACT|nr:ABC transporter ATP-binding protein [Desulfatibacillum alkenivorans]SHK77279.1 amino acid/amide ABC transporter ATP-binding protein 2, HAAT family [Desulfatibacillum alkenivorans DSM 16219]
MLQTTELNAFYGQFHVLHDVSIHVREQEVAAILGPNGHGKSTLLKSICGLVDQVQGAISYKGRDITGRPAEKLVNDGVIYIAENRELFPEMSVLENLKLGAYSKNARPFEKKNLAKVLELFPRLEERKKQLASTLSGGEARMLAIARGLMSNADFMCIDEPSLGLQPNLRVEVFNIIKEINKQGKSILLVEQNIPQIAELADRIYMLEEGRITFEGTAQEAGENEHLKEIFLGM